MEQALSWRGFHFNQSGSDSLINEVDILMASETKLEDILPTSQFLMQGYSIPFRTERTLNEGPILFNIRVEVSLAK